MAAYCVDNAVSVFGTLVENALLERINTGTKEKPIWGDKYTLEQLLDASFYLPPPLRAPASKPAPAQSGFQMLLALAAQGPKSGIKLWEYRKPN